MLACLVALALAAPAPNQLTDAEARAGYDLLFNGKDLNDWHAYRMDTVTNAWTVRNDEPLGPRIMQGTGQKLPILTDKQFQNFDLKVDVQVPVRGQSGIYLRYEENALHHANARSGPEFNICGPQNADCGTRLHQFGACYDMFAVTDSLRTSWYKPSGEWNQVRIVAFDSHYVHYGNGKKLLEYKIGTPEFMAAYDHSQWASNGGNGRYYHIHPGGFLLEHHGEEGTTFRNLKAKELRVHPFLREFPDGKWPEALPQDFVFGDVPIGTAPRAGRATGISTAYGGAGTTLVDVPAGHADFQVVGSDGRALPFRKVGENRYAVSRAGARGIAILRLRARGNPLVRIIPLP